MNDDDLSLSITLQKRKRERFFFLFPFAFFCLEGKKILREKKRGGCGGVMVNETKEKMG